MRAVAEPTIAGSAQHITHTSVSPRTHPRTSDRKRQSIHGFGTHGGGASCRQYAGSVSGSAPHGTAVVRFGCPS